MNKILDALQPFLPDRLVLARMHRWHHGTLRFFFYPSTMSEVINQIKLERHNSLRALTADKVGVREFVAERVGPEYLIPLLQVIERPEDLQLRELPGAFILKAAHGSGMNLIVRDGERSEEELRALIRGWQQTDFSRSLRERQYEKIPRRVAVEELLLNDEGETPADYKFFTFHGRAKMIQVDSTRFRHHERNLFTPEWRELAVRLTFPRPAKVPDRPETLDEMISVAETLAAPFGFARVDLYQHRGRVYFGEITHTPGGGSEKYDPPEFDRVLGSIWRDGGEIPAEYYRSLAVVEEDVRASEGSYLSSR